MSETKRLSQIEETDRYAVVLDSDGLCNLGIIRMLLGGAGDRGAREFVRRMQIRRVGRETWIFKNRDVIDAVAQWIDEHGYLRDPNDASASDSDESSEGD